MIGFKLFWVIFPEQHRWTTFNEESHRLRLQLINV